MERALDVSDRFVAEALTSQADGICAVTLRVIANGARVRQSVFHDDRKAADKSVAPNAAELMHRAVSANRRVISDGHVPGQRACVGEDAMRADVAIVGDMRLCHKQVVVADGRQATATGCAAIQRYVFADDVALPDDEPRLFALVFQILWRLTDGSEGIDDCAAADFAGAFDDNVPGDFDTIVQGNVIADERIGADFDVRAELRLGADDGGWVQHKVEFGIRNSEFGIISQSFRTPYSAFRISFLIPICQS